MKFDLHSHSTASDGKLSPSTVLAMAEEAQIKLFALTDHDNIDGYLSVRQKAKLNLVPGIEFSTTWSGVGVHIVGLDFEPDHDVLLSAIARQKKVRAERAEEISRRLAKKGFPGALEAVLRICPDINKVGRPHFAQFLYESGHVKSISAAFKQWLGKGKIGDVKSGWPDMHEAIEWINAASGVAVLAHPLKYHLTGAKLKRLLVDFKTSKGAGIEVTDANGDESRLAHLLSLTKMLGLAGSGGSDFHDPDWQHAQLGKVGDIPAGIEPIWHRFIRSQV